MGCQTFDEMLFTAQNHWSADHTVADSPLYAVTLPHDSTNNEPIETNKRTPILPDK